MKRLIPIAASVLALSVAAAIYVARLDRVVGMIVDDAWYVLLAKALATGQGYTLINSPTPGITPFYPPAFPALLAIFYRLSPHFPDNVWLLKSVSIAAMIGAGFVSFRYFSRYRALPGEVSFALAFATAIYPPLVFLATSTVMSECVYTLLQLGAIVLIERSVRRAGPGAAPASAWRSAAAGAALASLAFLTRAAGLGLVIGSVIYLLKEKSWKPTLVFTAVVAILTGPWILYSRSHQPTAEQRVEQGGSIVLSYSAQFFDRVAGRPDAGRITTADVPERVWDNLVEIGTADMGAFVFYSAFRPVEPGETVLISDAAVVSSLCFAFVALAGYIAAAREKWTLAEIATPLALATCVLWGWEQYRLLVPLAPFFFFYLWTGARSIVRSFRRITGGADRTGARGEAIALALVAWLFVVSALDGNYRYIQKKYHPVAANRTQWIRAFEENEAFIRYIGANVPKDETIAVGNPALVNLYTGHKTISSNSADVRWRVWNRLGVRYYATISPYPVEYDANQIRYPTIHRSEGFLDLRLLDLGPPASRGAWGKD